MEDFSRVGSELVLVMAKALVNHSEQVTVEVQEGENTTVILLKVGPGDLGQVLGRHGANAAAMRKILHGFACKSKRRTVLEIVDLAATQGLSQEAA